MLRRTYEDAIYSLTMSDTLRTYSYYSGFSMGILTAMLHTDEITPEEFKTLNNERAILLKSIKRRLIKNV